MSNRDEVEILNLISDLRSYKDEELELQERVAKLKDELEGAEDDLSSLKVTISNSREKLNELIDEATGGTSDTPETYPFGY